MTLALPDGIQPEGIAIGPGPKAYFGSLLDGRIYGVDLRNGRGREVSPSPGGGAVGVGLKTDGKGRAFVAGGGPGGENGLGDARIVDLRSGRILKTYDLKGGFVNDVVLGCGAAWFTDSFEPVLYRVPPDGKGRARTLRLTGDYQHYPPPDWNINGIATTPDGRALLIIHLTMPRLLRVDPKTGRATSVLLTGGPADPNDIGYGDGLLMLGRTLCMAVAGLQAIDVYRMDADGRRGRYQRRLTNPKFDYPTTIAYHRGRLYGANARFATDPKPDTPYTAEAVRI
jgi:sugar lactone lactonase YvrE